MLPFRGFTSFIWLILLTLYGCTKSESDAECDALSIGNPADQFCLLVEHPDLNVTVRAKVQAKITEGLSAIQEIMPINELYIRVIEDPQIIIPEIGLGGFNPDAHEVLLAINTGFPDLDRTLDENLIPLLAHEIHHAKRRRSVGYGVTLLEAIVSEGLADHFSTELTGKEPPPWSTALPGEDLHQWIDTARDSWDQPYEHEAWFFGTDPAIPRWTGYAIGYAIVQDYLTNHPGSLPSALHNAPANVFKP